MNNSPYFHLAGKFWMEFEKRPLSPVASLLYFYLLHEANNRFWQGPLRLSWTYLQGFLGLSSKQTLSNAISDLKTRGLITYKSPKGRKRSEFWFPDLKNGTEIVPFSENDEKMVRKSYHKNNDDEEMVQKSYHKSEMVRKSYHKVDHKVDHTLDIKDKIQIHNTNTKNSEGIYNNISTSSGVSKTQKNQDSDSPFLEHSILPHECIGIPCGKIIELYNFHFAKQVDINKLHKTTAQWMRERYIENPDLDWNDFFSFVARKSRAYTLNQIFMSKVFYMLLNEYKQEKLEEERVKRIAQRLREVAETEKKEARVGRIIPLGDVLKLPKKGGIG